MGNYHVQYWKCATVECDTRLDNRIQKGGKKKMYCDPCYKKARHKRHRIMRGVKFCMSCGLELPKKRSSKRVFCNHRCTMRYYKSLRNVPCKVCGINIFGSGLKHKHKFCSNRCGMIDYHRRELTRLLKETLSV